MCPMPERPRKCRAADGDTVGRNGGDVSESYDGVIRAIDDVQPIMLVVVLQAGRPEDAPRYAVVDGKTACDNVECKRTVFVDVDAHDAAIRRIAFVKRCHAKRPRVRRKRLPKGAVPWTAWQCREQGAVGTQDRIVVSGECRCPDGVVGCQRYRGAAEQRR